MRAGRRRAVTDRYEVSPTGRWGGRITSRALPDGGNDLATLSDEARRALIGVWLGQAATERRVGYSFEVVRDALRERGADEGLIETATRAIDDELRHAELCREMASRYAGRALPPPSDLPFAHPTHPSASGDTQRRALYVLGQCAFNETFASAYLESALAAATVPLAEAGLRELLSDEIDHARIGWAFASTLSAHERRELDSWLVPLAIANLREWRSIQLPETPREVLRAHGVPAREDVFAALLDALQSLMIPGFERFGFDVGPMRRWVARGAPTDVPAR